MATNSTTAEDRLAKLGIHLPEAPTPFGAYVPAVQTGNLLFLSGMLATSGHSVSGGREAIPQDILTGTGFLCTSQNPIAVFCDNRRTG